MARTSPASRSTRRPGMAQVGGYMADVDTVGMDPEMKATLRPKPAVKTPGVVESIKGLFKPKKKKGY